LYLRPGGGGVPDDECIELFSMYLSSFSPLDFEVGGLDLRGS
jgi:hypothetical protein